MKIKFTEQKREEDQFLPDAWIEEYPSLESVPQEMKDGCDLTIVFDCNSCKKEIETLNSADAILGICKDCQKSMDDHINKEDIEDE